jgi:DNA-binding CsgD family transcriptional regulator/tetratricopeptide (TPR) repeat protein
VEIPDCLRQGRESYDGRAWQAAYDAFVRADDAHPLDVEDLERLATAAFLTGRDEAFLRVVERVHRLHVDADDAVRAARAAFWLSFGSLLRGDVGQANAWAARGQRLIEGRECAERGYLLLPVAEQELRAGHAEAAYAMATDASALGEQCHDADLRAAARHLQGRALLTQAQMPSGLQCLDETMLAVIAGELSPIMSGLMYCSVIAACRDVYDLRRAREWTSALSRWCEEQSEMAAFTGTCLVHRSEILQLQGAWPDALAEARLACERSARADRKPPGAALYQQAEIHRLRGDCAGADEAYREASRLGYEPQPGLALLRLAQGRTDAALAALRRLLLTTSDRPQRARLLPAYVDVLLEAGDVDEACRASEELQALGGLLQTDALLAVGAHAQGAVALSRGDAGAAIGALRRAFELWNRLEAPYEAARVRVLLGRACLALGDEETSALETDAARLAFAELGAEPDLARLDAPPAPRAPAPGPLTARELEVLRLIAAGGTNRRIAGELCVSERTIDRHVSNILTKLDVPSRAAATAYAYAHQLL